MSAPVEIPEGFTPGPWWTAACYDGREMGCAVIAARTDAGPLPGNPTRGMVAFASAILNTDARRCEANARLIALAPNMAAELTALRADVQRLTDALAALKPFADFASASSFDRLPDDMPMTMGSKIARRQVTAGDFKAALRALTGAAS